jgi:hypothetical protein
MAFEDIFQRLLWMDARLAGPDGLVIYTDHGQDFYPGVTYMNQFHIKERTARNDMALLRQLGQVLDSKNITEKGHARRDQHGRVHLWRYTDQVALFAVNLLDQVIIPADLRQALREVIAKLTAQRDERVAAEQLYRQQRYGQPYRYRPYGLEGQPIEDEDEDEDP